MKERDALRQALRSNPERAAELLEKISPQPVPPDEELAVLCMPWPGMIDDSRKEACMRCGAAVAIAPSTQQMVDNYKAAVHFICMDCMTAPVN